MDAVSTFSTADACICAGAVFVFLGLALAALGLSRRLNDLGLVLRGFFLGAGLALVIAGGLFHINVPKEAFEGDGVHKQVARAMFNVDAPRGLFVRAAATAEPAAGVTVNLGHGAQRAIVQANKLFWMRLFYVLPVMAILMVALFCLASRRWFTWLFGEGFAQGVRGFVTALLVPVALLAAGNYTEFGKFRHSTYFNAYEFYHYYIGTKYAPEVGYSNMYNASLAADEETGRRYKNSGGTLRDLATGRHVKIEEKLAKKEEYKQLFSPERWQEFLKDIRFFKKELSTSRWSGILGDKGYNGTPFWTMWVGGLLSERVDTDNRTGMMMLALIDPLLICIALACVWRAFGIRAMLLMMVLMGTSYFMKFSHMKGAFLRTDFAMALVVAVCMLKLNHFRTAGALMMYAAISRVFPAVFFFGAGVKLLQNLVLHWRPSLRTLANGMVAALVLTLVLAAALHFSIPGDWSAALSAKLTFLPPAITGTALIIVFEVIVATAVAHGLVALWLWNKSPQCRPYVRLFSSALATLVLFSAAVMADPRTGKRYVDDFASKIGRHLSDISPWRVGYKYLFINAPAVHTERLNDERNKASVARSEAQPEAAAAPVADEAGDSPVEPDTDEAPALVAKANAAVKNDPMKARDDETGLARVLVSTYRDMKFAAEKAWKKTQEGGGDINRAALAQSKDLGEAKAALKGAVSPPQSYWEAVVKFSTNFFKGYVPVTRGRLYEEQKMEWWLTMGVVLALSFVAVLGLKDHEALSWSFVPLFFLVAPTYYYYIMMVIPLLFFTSALERPTRALGAILLLACAMPGYYFYSNLGYGQQFATYYWHSVMFLFLCGYMLLIAYWDTLIAAVNWALGRPSGKAHA
jgi:hypothetical protein